MCLHYTDQSVHYNIYLYNNRPKLRDPTKYKNGPALTASVTQIRKWVTLFRDFSDVLTRVIASVITSLGLPLL